MAVGIIGSRLVWGADFLHGLTKKFCFLRRDSEEGRDGGGREGGRISLVMDSCHTDG